MRLRGKKQKRLWLILAGIVLAAAAGLFFYGMYSPKERSARETGAKAETSENTVIWQGKKYKYNEHLSNYLLIGVDNEKQVQTEQGSAQAGQADALYLVSWDRVEETMTMITIPRDTMTDIEVFGPDGESFGKTKDHISLSYAYGDGGHESCRLAKEAVSNLFYGLPIQGYCSVSMDGISALTQSVGSVTVTVPNDSLVQADPAFAPGTSVELTPENTELFVRYRDTSVSQSALDRTERQKEYLRAFGEAARKAMTQDPGYAVDLYQALEPYMVTGMGKDEFAKLAQSAASGSTAEGWMVPGEGVEGKSYDEYHVDEDALYEKIIETFYRETE